MARTSFVWICRQESTVEALQGLVATLEAQGGLKYATVKIMTVEPDRPVEVPPGLTGPDGRPFGARIFTTDNCPAGGLLFLDESED
jgi:hypothetical protein